ncbi:MAG: GNAT family N-acetyltransferase [Clostridia bacterium]|nr:GNAT family N-acetyltransferase [Clostridia bacterium]
MTDIPYPLEIRPIVPGDEEQINTFFETMVGESRALFNRHSGNQNAVLDFCRTQNTDRRQYWMALLDGQMAGLVFLWDLHTSIPWLGIAVREDLRGKHLGRTLISFAQEYVRSHGKGGIQLTTHPANLRGQSLYETMGFTRLGTYGASGEWYYLFRFQD